MENQLMEIDVAIENLSKAQEKWFQPDRAEKIRGLIKKKERILSQSIKVGDKVQVIGVGSGDDEEQIEHFIVVGSEGEVVFVADWWATVRGKNEDGEELDQSVQLIHLKKKGGSDESNGN